MLVWFTMLAVLGLAHLADDFSILQSLQSSLCYFIS